MGEKAEGREGREGKKGRESRRVASHRSGIVQKLRIRRFLQIRRATRETYMPSPATKIKTRPATFSPARLYYAIFSEFEADILLCTLRTCRAMRFYAALECVMVLPNGNGTVDPFPL